MPYEYNVPDGVGFWSGDMSSDVSPFARPTYAITVNDTCPVFFYCAAPGSFKSNSMIGVINPNDTQTLQKQKDAIKPNILDLSPADPRPSEPGHGHGHGHGKKPTSCGLSAGAIAGIAIAGIVVLLLAGALVYFLLRRRRRQFHHGEINLTCLHILI
ncbi:hypothetical protein F5Y17DRAFT_434639 [Xylariaceae sp. FL0594]|nr:hypothetical protein F5Y17DRAFT_434639 [Xylariaceae sp. FL0594]